MALDRSSDVPYAIGRNERVCPTFRIRLASSYSALASLAPGYLLWPSPSSRCRTFSLHFSSSILYVFQYAHALCMTIDRPGPLVGCNSDSSLHIPSRRSLPSVMLSPLSTSRVSMYFCFLHLKSIWIRRTSGNVYPYEIIAAITVAAASAACRTSCSRCVSGSQATTRLTAFACFNIKARNRIP